MRSGPTVGRPEEAEQVQNVNPDARFRSDQYKDGGSVRGRNIGIPEDAWNRMLATPLETATPLNAATLTASFQPHATEAGAPASVASDYKHERINYQDVKFDAPFQMLQ